MAKKLPMELEEAQWKLERDLVKQGYSMNGSWTSKYHKGEKILTLSRNLKDYPEHVRAVLWLEGTSWVGGISVLVEEYGEYLLTYGKVLSRGDSYTPQTHRLLKKRLEKVMPMLSAWRLVKPTSDAAHLVLIYLALEFLRSKEISRAISVLLMAARGELLSSWTTVSEALEIVQLRFGRDIQEYALIAQNFEKVFK